MSEREREREREKRSLERPDNVSVTDALLYVCVCMDLVF